MCIIYNFRSKWIANLLTFGGVIVPAWPISTQTWRDVTSLFPYVQWYGLCHYTVRCKSIDNFSGRHFFNFARTWKINHFIQFYLTTVFWLVILYYPIKVFLLCSKSFTTRYHHARHGTFGNKFISHNIYKYHKHGGCR